MDIEIGLYNEGYKSQVIDLFVTEYGNNRKQFIEYFERFYFHPFQKGKCILIVATHGEIVAGFQSFFYWPYQYNNKIYRSYQSGNSIINSAYRGKGLFQKMLQYFEKENKQDKIDFLLGFPVEASLKNFIKDGWSNILNLNWHIKFCNPLGFFPSSFKKDFEAGCYYPSYYIAEEKIVPPYMEECILWRKNYMNGKYYTYTYQSGRDAITFHLRKQKRKKYLNEIVIGNILYGSIESKKLLHKAIKTLVRKLRFSFSAHFISFAVNTKACEFETNTFLKSGFMSAKKSIYFIVKPYHNNSFTLEADKWVLYRSDIDTW